VPADSTTRHHRRSSPQFAASDNTGAAPAPDLSVIIVNWNARHVLRDCLDSILRPPRPICLELIVIDNGSADGSSAMLARDFPGIRLIANATNRGFAAANNQGIRLARAPYVLLLNPDTIVLDDALEETLAYARAHPDIAVLGCQVLEHPTIIQRTCFRFPSPLNTLLWLIGASSRFPRSPILGRATYGPWDRRSERQVDVVSGMFMLVPRRAIDDVGLLDEGYFMFTEEADWCRRFWNAGWRCVFAPVGRILHVDGGGKSTEQASVDAHVQMQQSVLRYHRKHLGFLSWMLTKLLFATSSLLRTLCWSLCAAFHLGRSSPHKARQSAQAARFHWTRTGA
jgi:GT2 family glycosyltransferase